jgi:hypothetical protein
MEKEVYYDFENRNAKANFLIRYGTKITTIDLALAEKDPDFIVKKTEDNGILNYKIKLVYDPSKLN